MKKINQKLMITTFVLAGLMSFDVQAMFPWDNWFNQGQQNQQAWQQQVQQQFQQQNKYNSPNNKISNNIVIKDVNGCNFQNIGNHIVVNNDRIDNSYNEKKLQEQYKKEQKQIEEYETIYNKINNILRDRQVVVNPLEGPYTLDNDVRIASHKTLAKIDCFGIAPKPVEGTKKYLGAIATFTMLMQNQYQNLPLLVGYLYDSSKATYGKELNNIGPNLSKEQCVYKINDSIKNSVKNSIFEYLCYIKCDQDYGLNDDPTNIPHILRLLAYTNMVEYTNTNSFAMFIDHCENSAQGLIQKQNNKMQYVLIGNKSHNHEQLLDDIFTDSKKMVFVYALFNALRNAKTSDASIADLMEKFNLSQGYKQLLKMKK